MSQPARTGAKTRPRPSNSTTSRGERLQKILAAAGLGSRRQCEQLILAGRVQVDRSVVTVLGTRADRSAEIRVDGESLPNPGQVYYLVNKPVGVVSTHRDPQGRPRVVDLVPGGRQLFPVGRLDKSSEGLILVTNDGQLANRLTHPRYAVEKTYLAEVDGQPSEASLAQLRKGVRLAEGWARVLRLHVKRRRKHTTVLEIVLSEGRNREIRRILARAGHKVRRLQRTALGPLRLGDVPPGAHRRLTKAELKKLKHVAGLTCGKVE